MQGRPVVGIDATPLATGHGVRGIGRYLRGILAALANVQPDWMRENVGILIARGQTPPVEVSTWVTMRSRVRPQDLDPFIARLVDPVVVRHAPPHVWQHTDPAVPYSPAIHLHDLRFGVAEAALSSRVWGIPTFVHTHGLLFHTGDLERLKSLAMRFYYGPLLGRAHGVILASSESDIRHLSLRAPSLLSKTRYFPNAIELADLLRVVPNRRKGYLLVHGRVARTKRIDRAIEAVATLGRDDVRLRIAGTPEPGETSRLRDVAQACGIADQVQFIGPYDDRELPGLFSETDVALFPSPGEGFGLALLEALAAGVPVVANDIPAHREVCGADLSSWMADFSNPSATARAIARILDLEDGEWGRLGRLARERARTFDLHERLLQLDALYRQWGVMPRSPAEPHRGVGAGPREPST